MLLQDAIVALLALGAAVIVVRQVVGFASRDTSPKCANCASGPGCDVSPSSARATSGPAAPATHPLVFVRQPRA